MDKAYDTNLVNHAQRGLASRMTDANFTNDFQTLQYEALSNFTGNIRVLVILRYPRAGLVDCMLREISLSGNYICISYLWGTEADSHAILINGKLLMVRRNLWALLCQVRKG